jgi:hypothetical protein
MKKLDDMRGPGAVLFLAAGALGLFTGIQTGVWWKALAGFGLIVFGFGLGYYLRRESEKGF